MYWFIIIIECICNADSACNVCSLFIIQVYFQDYHIFISVQNVGGVPIVSCCALHINPFVRLSSNEISIHHLNYLHLRWVYNAKSSNDAVYFQIFIFLSKRTFFIKLIIINFIVVWNIGFEIRLN